MEGQLDIQYDKTVEWLLSRRKLKEDWPTALRGIQAKASLAKENNLADEACRAFLAKHADELDFFKVQELWELIEKSDDGKKTNLFGQYQVPEVKAWKQVLDLYKRNNTHLAEAARSLVQTVRYDIPAAKSQAQACQKQVQDAERRQSDLNKREVEAKRRFREMCDLHQIAGVNLRSELEDHIRLELPKILDQCCTILASNCPDALRFYGAFSKYVLSGDAVAEQDLFPLLRFLIANGNAFLKDASSLNDELKAEWTKVQEQWKNKEKSDKTDTGGIDWGGVDLGGITLESNTDAISWDIGGGGDTSGGGGISWDFEVEDGGGGNAVSGDDVGASLVVDGIDWGAVSMDGIGVNSAIETAEEGPDSVRLLANSRSRGLVVDELLELEAFLAQRCWELEERGGAEGQLAQSSNTEVQLTADETKKMHSQVTAVIDAFCGKQVQPIFLMHGSESALKHAVSQLATQKMLCEKPGREYSSLERRKAELSREAGVNLKEAARLRENAQKLKKRLEEEIERLMKHKTRLVGDVNTV